MKNFGPVNFRKAEDRLVCAGGKGNRQFRPPQGNIFIVFYDIYPVTFASPCLFSCLTCESLWKYCKAPPKE